MKFLVLSSTNPYYNLAVEEYLFSTATDSVFMLWQNEPTVVIGKNQNAYTEINKEYLDTKGIHLARRITGGGAVYHDLGNVNYSFIKPNSNSQQLDFQEFTKPIIDALKSMGLNARLSGRNDVETDTGLKISGNAQHRNNERVLHHGTLLFSTDLSVMDNVLTPDRDKLISKAVKSVKKRVCNVSELVAVNSVNEFINVIKNHVIKEFNAKVISPPKHQEIKSLIEKYSSKNFIYGEKPLITEYDKVYKKRFDFGSVELRLKMRNDVIIEVKFSGDFFEVNAISQLENLLVNKKISELSNVIKRAKIENYVSRMSYEDFIMLIS